MLPRIRKDFWEGPREGKIPFFPATETNPIAVFYLHPEQSEIWGEAFPEYGESLLDFIELLEANHTKFCVFGFWPGKSRSDIFPLNRRTVCELCEISIRSNTEASDKTAQPN